MHWCNRSRVFGKSLPFVLPVVLPLLAGPAAMLSGTASRADASDLYVVIGTPGDLDRVTDLTGVREIGPYRTPVARMVQAPAADHARLIDMRFWVFPASALAAICGVT